MDENTEIEDSSKPAVTEKLPSSGYGLVSVIIGSIFFASMIIFALNAGIITMTSKESILDVEEIVTILYSYLTSGGPGSIVGIAFGIAGFMQNDRSKFLPCWGLVLNFINLNGALLCLVVLNIEA